MKLDDTAVLDWLDGHSGSRLQLVPTMWGRATHPNFHCPGDRFFARAARAGALSSLKWVEQRGGWIRNSSMLEALLDRAIEGGSVACLTWLEKRRRYESGNWASYFAAPPVEAAAVIADWVLKQAAYPAPVIAAVKGAVLHHGQLALIPWLLEHCLESIEWLVAQTLWQRKEAIAIVLVRYLPPDSPFLASLLALVPPRK